MILFEFSLLKELLYIFTGFILLTGCTFTACKYGFLLLNGKLKYLLTIPVIIQFTMTFELYGDFQSLMVNRDMYEGGKHKILGGKLLNVYHKKDKNFYTASPITPVYSEIIVTSNGMLKRDEPKLSTGTIGCLQNNIEDDLKSYLNKHIEIKYIEKKIKNITPLIYCILEVKVIER